MCDTPTRCSAKGPGSSNSYCCLKWGECHHVRTQRQTRYETRKKKMVPTTFSAQQLACSKMSSSKLSTSCYHIQQPLANRQAKRRWQRSGHNQVHILEARYKVNAANLLWRETDLSLIITIRQPLAECQTWWNDNWGPWEAQKHWWGEKRNSYLL